MDYSKYGILLLIGVLFGIALWAFSTPKLKPRDRPIRWKDPALGDYKSITWRD